MIYKGLSHLGGNTKAKEFGDSPTTTTNNKATKICDGRYYNSIEEEVISYPSESPREATRILCSIITPTWINTVTVDPAQARHLMIG